MEWESLQQDIANFKKRTFQTNELRIDEIWDMYSEGLFLKENFDEFLPKIETNTSVQIIGDLTHAQQMLRTEILERAPSHSQEMKDWIVKRVEDLEILVRSLLSDVEHAPLFIVSEFQSVAHELMFLKRLNHLLTKGKDCGVLVDTLNEIYYLVMQSHELKDLFSEPILKKELPVLRNSALDKEVEEFNRNAMAVQQKPNIKSLRHALHWGTDLQPNISRSDPDQGQLLKNCRSHRGLLKSKIKQEFLDFDKEKRARHLEYFIVEVQDRVDDVMVSSEEKSLPIAIKSLEIVLEDVLWLIDIVEDDFKEEIEEEHLKEKFKKLKKKKGSLDREILEKKIQERLENLFGRRFVRNFNFFILFLIFLVIGLLIVEFFIPATEKGILFTFMVIDTIACFFFLTEFFTKLFLADNRWLYFKLNCLTEFLPSIPFGLIHHILHVLDLHQVLAVRGIRLIRLIRFVRIFRVITFLIRGTDRLVRYYGRWLNRNIVFFSNAEKANTRRVPSLDERIYKLRNFCLSRSRSIFENIRDKETQIKFTACYIEILEVFMKQKKMGTFVKPMARTSTNVAIEDVISDMLYLKGTQVEEIIGREFPEKLYQYLRIFNSSIFRNLPLVGRFLRQHKELEAAEFTAWIGRGIGRLAERFLAMLYWFSDMYGIVTPTRVLDRVGNFLEEAFKRPAKRLFIVGVVFVFLNILLNIFQLPIFAGMIEFLNRFLGLPLIIIGGICWIPFLLGSWLQKVAGQATDFYMRTAEAQFINLLEDIKFETSDKDLRILFHRVLRPELILLKGDIDSCPTEEEIIKDWKEQLINWAIEDPEHDHGMETRHQARTWSRQYQIFLLYRDYLDGAPLHRSDIKTTEQLLGNMAMENIRMHRLRYSKKDYKKLEKLDLEKSKSLFSGPYLWFSFITQSIANNTAALIVEYNKYCTPVSLLGGQRQEKVDQYKKWLQKRLEKTGIQEDPAQDIRDGKRSLNTHPSYMTTRFTALHFLTIRPKQDASIRLIFGDELYKAFVKDRVELFRDIFGTFPLDELPQQQRMFNPYNLYQTYMAGGRIFTLPFKMIYWAGALILFSVTWFYQRVRELIDPKKTPKPSHEVAASFDVALRNINRMRKPVYMECMKLRAQFDFEYLGLTFPGLPELEFNNLEWQCTTFKKKGMDGWAGLFEKDLDFIQAMDAERDYFHDLYKDRHEKLKALSNIFARRGWHGEKFDEFISAIDPNLVVRKIAIIKALATAYTINYQDLTILLNSQQILEDTFDEVIARNGDIPEFYLGKKIKLFFGRMIKTACFLYKDRELRNFEKFWAASKYIENPDQATQKKWCWRVYLLESAKLKSPLDFITNDGDPKEADEIIRSIICNPMPWTEETIAIRTIQTLSVLDVLNYRRHVALLGDYPEKKTYMK